MAIDVAPVETDRGPIYLAIRIACTEQNSTNAELFHGQHSDNDRYHTLSYLNVAIVHS